MEDLKNIYKQKRNNAVEVIRKEKQKYYEQEIIINKIQ